LRHTPDGYNLIIKNTGEHDNKPIGKRWLDVLGAQDPGPDKPMLFTLVDRQNNPITLKNMSTPQVPVSLMTENKKYIGGLKVRGSPYIYLAETEEKSKVTFILSVL
jgi:hypothetical protein